MVALFGDGCVSARARRGAVSGMGLVAKRRQEVWVRSTGAATVATSVIGRGVAAASARALATRARVWLAPFRRLLIDAVAPDPLLVESFADAPEEEACPPD
jgi:hypothetical protein